MLTQYYKIIEELKNSEEEYLTGRLDCTPVVRNEYEFARTLKENGFYDFRLNFQLNPVDRKGFLGLVCDSFIDYRISTKQYATEDEWYQEKLGLDNQKGEGSLFWPLIIIGFLILGGIFIW